MCRVIDRVGKETHTFFGGCVKEGSLQANRLFLAVLFVVGIFVVFWSFADAVSTLRICKRVVPAGDTDIIILVGQIVAEAFTQSTDVLLFRLAN